VLVVSQEQLKMIHEVNQNAFIFEKTALKRKIQTVAIRLGIAVATLASISDPGFSQARALLAESNPPNSSRQVADSGPASAPAADAPDAAPESDNNISSNHMEQEGVVRRSVKRTLGDQMELYLTPLHPSNLKWDLTLLAGTGALIATDRRIEGHLPSGNIGAYSNMSNVALGSIAGTLSFAWPMGSRPNNEHLKETGSLELETLVNTFLA